MTLSGGSRRLLHGSACGWTRFGFGARSMLHVRLSGREKLQDFSLKHGMDQREGSGRG